MPLSRRQWLAAMASGLSASLLPARSQAQPPGAMPSGRKTKDLTIKEVRVTPVALPDPPLLAASGCHDEAGKVTFYILDSEGKKDVPIEAKEITIDVKIGENAPKTFTLAALNPQDGKTAAFELVDANLEGALEAKGVGTVCTLHVNVNGKQFDQEIKEEVHTDAH